jgi:hypothetical protein
MAMDRMPSAMKRPSVNPVPTAAFTTASHRITA